jgi:hypothetical protein
MKLTNVEIVSGDISVASFNLQAPDLTDRFAAKAMTGLDAPEILPTFYGFGAFSNAEFYQLGLKSREIVIRLALTPNWQLGETYSDLRDDLYRAISKTRNGKVQVRLNNSAMTVATISGHITKFEVPHFNQEPEVQITIKCDDPMLRSDGYFEYVAADFNNTGYFQIPDNSSTAPHGFEMQVTFLSGTSDFVLLDDPDFEWEFSVVPASAFIAGDILYFSSEHGQKSLWHQRGEVVTYLMDRMTTTSNWPLIFPGNNVFYCPNLDNSSVEVDFLRFRSAYWGV